MAGARGRRGGSTSQAGLRALPDGAPWKNHPRSKKMLPLGWGRQLHSAPVSMRRGSLLYLLRAERLLSRRTWCHSTPALNPEANGPSPPHSRFPGPPGATAGVHMRGVTAPAWLVRSAAARRPRCFLSLVPKEACGHAHVTGSTSAAGAGGGGMQAAAPSASAKRFRNRSGEVTPEVDRVHQTALGRESTRGHQQRWSRVAASTQRTK